jgi:hypothetical protein
MRTFQTPPLHGSAASRQSTAARKGRTVKQYTAEDGVALVSHSAALFKWYREGVLGGTFGNLIKRVLVNKDDRFSRVKKTGDLGELVDPR